MTTRYMTLRDAQALECNRCGDCCSSERALDSNGWEVGWQWGADTSGDNYRALNAGRPLLIPLFTDRGENQTAGRIDSYRCTALAFPSGKAACGLRAGGREVPSTCSAFPVSEGYASDILLKLFTGSDEVELRTLGLVRCTWHDVVITAPE